LGLSASVDVSVEVEVEVEVEVDVDVEVDVAVAEESADGLDGESAGEGISYGADGVSFLAEGSALLDLSEPPAGLCFFATAALAAGLAANARLLPSMSGAGSRKSAASHRIA
jgi:hypothetical protein